MQKRLVTDAEFENLLANGQQMQLSALMGVVGSMRAAHGVSPACDAAKAELKRARGAGCSPNRKVLIQGWAEWYLAVEVASGRAVDCRSVTIRTGEPDYKVSYRGAQEGVYGTVFYDGGYRPEVVGRFLIGRNGDTTIKGFLVDSPLVATARLIAAHKEGRRLIAMQAAAFGVPA